MSRMREKHNTNKSGKENTQEQKERSVNNRMNRRKGQQ